MVSRLFLFGGGALSAANMHPKMCYPEAGIRADPTIIEMVDKYSHDERENRRGPRFYMHL